MNYSNRNIAIICNKLFPRNIEIDLKTIHQCIEEEMGKSEDLVWILLMKLIRDAKRL